MVYGEIEMIFMIRILLILLFLTGCDAFPLYGYAFNSVKNSIFGYEDTPLTQEVVDKIPYAFIKARIGKGPSVIMILVNEKNGVLEWISADKVKIYTFNGKIIRTAGLENDIQIIDYTKFPKLEEELLKQKLEISYLANFFNPELYEFDIFNQIEIISAEETLSTSLGQRTVIKVYESFEAKSINWDGQNTYYVSNSGDVEKTIQQIHPFLPTIQIEYIKKFRRKSS